SYWVNQLSLFKPKIIIADEVHFLKSEKTKRTKAVKRLAKFIKQFIGLSGTPIVNRPIEIYNAISIINSTVVPSFFHFAKRYCGAVNNGFGWEYNGATNMEELHELLTSTIMIRRKKTEVLKDLPDKIYSYVPLDLTNWDEYSL